MLIRWAVKDDKPAWTELAATVAGLFDSPNMPASKSFQDYMDSKTEKFEALIAVERMSGKCLGVIGFSRKNNRISWFAVHPERRGKGIGKRLLDTALRHLDTSREVTVVTFTKDKVAGMAARAVYEKAGFSGSGEFTDENGNKRCRMIRPPSGEKRGGSFHYDYPRYNTYSEIENCLCCNQAPMHESMLDIAELEHSFATAERIAQGRLFGKCHVLIKNHHVNFEEIPFNEMSGFMADVQKTGKALRKVSGAVKINYEIHSNSGPHIHCHLFPRYLDDDFPSAPIDYRVTEPSPYESEEEFMWFVARMREELGKL